MEPLTVVIVDTKGTAKDPHPLGKQPVKPVEWEFKDKEKYAKALETFTQDSLKWEEIDKTLKFYIISSIITDVGETISAKVLHFHVGKQYKAKMDMRFEGNIIQII